MTAATNQLELSVSLLTRLESMNNSLITGKPVSDAERLRYSLKLNKVYLALLNLFFVMGDKADQIQQLIEQIEGRLESHLDEPMTFKLINELANILRKHNKLVVAV